MCLAFLKFQGTYAEEMPYFVMEDGKSCPAGSEIKTQDDCNQALEGASDLGIMLQSQKQLVVGSFPHIPYQCSYFASGDQAFHFNHDQNTNSNRLCKSNEFRMICRGKSSSFRYKSNQKYIPVSTTIFSPDC